MIERELELKPRVGVYDSETRELEFFELKHEPSEKVFSYTEKAKSSEESVLAFIEKLKSRVAGVSFRDNLRTYYKENDVTPEVREIVDGILEEVGDKDV